MGLSEDNNRFFPTLQKLETGFEKVKNEMGKALFGVNTIHLSKKFTTSQTDSLQQNHTLNFDKINFALQNKALLLVTDTNGVIIYLNEPCRESLGYEPNELIGKHTRIFKTGIHSKEFYHQLWTTLLSGEIWKGEITAKRKDGSTEWYFMIITPLLDEQYKPYQFLTFRFDITEQKNLEKQAQLKDKQLDSFFEVLSSAVLGCMKQDGKIFYLSQAVGNILGYMESERIGGSIYDNIAPDFLPNFQKAMEELIKTPDGSFSMEIQVKRKNGSLLPVEFMAKNYLSDNLLNSIIFTYRDITQQKEMDNITYYDVLTGIPNYRCFDEKLSTEINKAKANNTSVAVIQMGLDDFKYVNSTFGHLIGDELLKIFSKKFENHVTDNITMYRMSGDIFGFIISDVLDVEEIPKVLSKWISMLNKEPFYLDGNEMYISVSIGVSLFPFSGENQWTLLKNAEIAMYRAKNNGKNQYQVFSPTMDLYSFKQFTLRNDLRNALLKDELNLNYQPRIDPMTDHIVSAEALIRWNHPKWGMVLPDEFISMAEDTGLIISFGEWIIRKVCSTMKNWEEDNLNVKKMSINISPLQLLHPNFIDMVSSILNEINVNPKWIEFEITENVIIKQEEEALNKLTKIKNIGISIALDDFGTGYSSLSYLKKFPCETIKIDKSLIKDIHKDKQNHEIVGSIISLCHKLNKKVVAEGVEVREDLFILRKLHCDEIQGYLYSKPVDELMYKKLLIEGIGINGKKAEQNPYANNRKYFRVPFDIPLVADMTIKEIANKKVEIGNTEVIIKNIGPGGLCFYSPLKLPVGKNILLQFGTVIFSEELTLTGLIVWSNDAESNYYQYGVEFAISNLDREKLIKILGNLQVKLKNKSTLPDCRFFTK